MPTGFWILDYDGRSCRVCGPGPCDADITVSIFSTHRPHRCVLFGEYRMVTDLFDPLRQELDAISRSYTTSQPALHLPTIASRLPRLPAELMEMVLVGINDYATLESFRASCLQFHHIASDPLNLQPIIRFNTTRNLATWKLWRMSKWFVCNNDFEIGSGCNECENPDIKELRTSDIPADRARAILLQMKQVRGTRCDVSEFILATDQVALYRPLMQVVDWLLDEWAGEQFPYMSLHRMPARERLLAQELLNYLESYV